jgi:hypothetical protein
MLENNKLNIPEGRPLPGDENGGMMPFYVVADEAFGLSKHVLRPYAKKTCPFLKDFSTIDTVEHADLLSAHLEF